MHASWDAHTAFAMGWGRPFAHGAVGREVTASEDAHSKGDSVGAHEVVYTGQVM